MKFSELTSPEIAELDREATVVVIPIAAVEQHGPHLPTGTDTIICTALAEAIEEQRPEILLLPTMWLGASAHHLRFGATLDSALPHYIEMLTDIVNSLTGDGFRRFILLNGHGGNVDPLKVALRQVQQEHPESLFVGGAYWGVADDLLATQLTGEHKFVGHACEFETSMIMHLRPDLVRHDQLADAGPLIDADFSGLYVSRDMKHRTPRGCTGSPQLATAEKGEAMFHGLVDRLLEVFDRAAKEPLGKTYDDFIV